MVLLSCSVLVMAIKPFGPVSIISVKLKDAKLIGSSKVTSMKSNSSTCFPVGDAEVMAGGAVSIVNIELDSAEIYIPSNP